MSYKRILLATVAGTAVLPTDADVTAYVTAVNAAGGTVPTTQRNMLNSAWTTMKATAPNLRAKLKEVWIALGADGDLTTAAVKFINGATTASVALTNFVTGDYTVALGINAGTGNSTKRVVTDFQPSVNGSLTAAEWGFSVYQTKIHTAGVMMGMNANTNAFISYVAGAQSKINSTALNFAGSRQFINKRLSTVQTTGGTESAYAGGYSNGTVANAGVMPTGGMSVFASGASVFSDGASSGYAIHSPLTPVELRAFQTFMDTVCEGIGRTIFVNDVTAPGDSYVAGPNPTGPSVPANDYIAVYAASKGWNWNFQGVSGRGWARSGNSMQAQAGIDAVFKGMLQVPSKHCIIPQGLNDANFSSLASDVSVSQLAVFDMITAVGYPIAYIAIGTCYWSSMVPDQSLAAAIHDVTVTNAATYGYKLIDFYHGLTADPAVGGQAPSLAVAMSYQDGSVLHKNDSGHVKLAADVANYTGW